MINYNKELSIQITLSGFSFQIDTPQRKGKGFVASYDIDSAIANCDTLDTIIEWSNSEVLIVPIELFDHSLVEESLMAVGFLSQDDRERAMYRVCNEYVALWAMSAELYDYLKMKFPNAEHTHSLLELLSRSANHRGAIALDVDNSGILHIAVWGESVLLHAMSVQVNATEDILFYVRKLSTEADYMMQYDILLTRNIESEVQNLLSHYYDNIFIL